MSYQRITLDEQLMKLAQGTPTDMPAGHIIKWAREVYDPRPKRPRMGKGDSTAYLNKLYALPDARS